MTLKFVPRLFCSAIDHLSWCHQWRLLFDSWSLSLEACELERGALHVALFFNPCLFGVHGLLKNWTLECTCLFEYFGNDIKKKKKKKGPLVGPLVNPKWEKLDGLNLGPLWTLGRARTPMKFLKRGRFCCAWNIIWGLFYFGLWFRLLGLGKTRKARICFFHCGPNCDNLKWLEVEHLVAIGFWIFGYWHLDSIWLFYLPNLFFKTCKGLRCFKLDPYFWLIFGPWSGNFLKKLAIKKLCLIFATPGNMNMASSKPKYEFADNYWTLEISLHAGGRGSRPSYKQASCGGVSWHFKAAVTLLFYFFGAKFRNAANEEKKKKVPGKMVQRNFLEKILNIRYSHISRV